MPGLPIVDSYFDEQVDAVSKMLAPGSFSGQLTFWPNVGLTKMRLSFFWPIVRP